MPPPELGIGRLDSQKAFDQQSAAHINAVPQLYHPARPSLNAPYGVMMSPKTQQAHAQMENPKYQAYENSGVIRGHSYFPGNDNAAFNSEHISLEQARYL